MQKAIQDKSLKKITQVFQETVLNVPDIYDQKGLRVLFDYLLQRCTAADEQATQIQEMKRELSDL